MKKNITSKIENKIAMKFYVVLYPSILQTSLVAEWNRGRNYVIYKILIITDCPSMVLGLDLID